MWLQRKSLSLLLVVVLGSLWGLHFSLIKICAESSLSRVDILLLTTAGSACGFFCIAWTKKQLPHFSFTHWRFYIICAAFGYSGPIFIELLVAQYLSAGTLTLIVSTSPLVTLCVAAVLKTEKVNRRGLIGILLGTLAILFLLIPTLRGEQAVSASIVAATFIVPIAYGSYHHYVVKAWPHNDRPLQVASGSMLAACLILLPLLMFNPVDLPRSENLFIYGVLAAMSIFAVLEVLLYFAIIRAAGAVTVSLSNFVTIVAGVVWGMLIFDERPSLWVWLCAGILLLAVYLVLSSRFKAIKTTT
jgi:drug/metabolite transporter (DMT)-like permease